MFKDFTVSWPCLKGFYFIKVIRKKNAGRWQIISYGNKKQTDKTISSLSTKCFVRPLTSQLYLGTSVTDERPLKKNEVNWIKLGFMWKEC